MRPVCIIYYRAEHREVYSRADWMAAPFRDVQGLLTVRPLGDGYYVEVRVDGADDRDPVWYWHAGEQFWLWRDEQETPFSGDWAEVLDYLRERGKLAYGQSWAEAMSFELLREEGIKYGLNLSNAEFQAVFQRMRADRERLA